MQTDAPFWDSLAFDGIDEVDVEAVTAAFGTVEVMARGRAAGGACPDCGGFSDLVHDRYQRRLQDLPLAEQHFVTASSPSALFRPPPGRPGGPVVAGSGRGGVR
ncbi:hypothetical protein ACQPZG_00240 (plasmid) [Streptomyces sp. CA-294286]|uniref:hypothetical protein n=1 Tax=Streptomyces sp. CA-294286 TaxID=3240070 RepID=UPI003D8DC781